MEYTSLPQALEALEKLQSTLFAYNHAMGILRTPPPPPLRAPGKPGGKPWRC